MKITQITVSASRTINLGNYESMQVQGSCTVEIDDAKELPDARKAAVEECKTQMNEAYKAIRPKK